MKQLEPFNAAAATLIIALACLSACDTAKQPQSTLLPAQQVGDAQLLTAQANHSRHIEVTASAFVEKSLPDDTAGLPHERFLLRLSNGTTVLVAHDIAMAPRVPLHEGDLISLRGEYIYNNKGGVVHWTHHSDNGRHESGWIDWHGKRYQ